MLCKNRSNDPFFTRNFLIFPQSRFFLNLPRVGCPQKETNTQKKRIFTNFCGENWDTLKTVVDITLKLGSNLYLFS